MHDRDLDLEERPKALSEWHRDYPERRIAGVCAGIAAHFDLPLTLVRAGYILGALLGPSAVIVGGSYLALWFLMPDRPGEPSGLDRLVDLVDGWGSSARDRIERSDHDLHR